MGGVHLCHHLVISHPGRFKVLRINSIRRMKNLEESQIRLEDHSPASTANEKAKILTQLHVFLRCQSTVDLFMHFMNFSKESSAEQFLDQVLLIKGIQAKVWRNCLHTSTQPTHFNPNGWASTWMTTFQARVALDSQRWWDRQGSKRGGSVLQVLPAGTYGKRSLYGQCAVFGIICRTPPPQLLRILV